MRGKPQSGFRLTRKRIARGILTPELEQKYHDLENARLAAARYNITPHPTADYTVNLRKALAEVNAKSRSPQAPAAGQNATSATKPRNGRRGVTQTAQAA